MGIYDMSHDSTQNGVAEELQTFVVDGLPFLAAHDALVHQRLLVVFDVIGEEAQNLV